MVEIEEKYLGYELALLEGTIDQCDLAVAVKLGASHPKLVCRLDYTPYTCGSRVVQKASKRRKVVWL